MVAQNTLRMYIGNQIFFEKAFQVWSWCRSKQIRILCTFAPISELPSNIVTLRLLGRFPSWFRPNFIQRLTIFSLWNMPGNKYLIFWFFLGFCLFTEWFRNYRIFNIPTLGCGPRMKLTGFDTLRRKIWIRINNQENRWILSILTL